MARGTTKRSATYGRQSKQREDESTASPQAQREKATAFVAARGWTHIGHFEDVGASGYDPKAARPGLDALLATVRAGEVDHVVVYRLDRLTRRGVVEATRLVEVLRENGASLASVEEPFLDTSTPMGQGIFGLFAAMAEQESANISARTRAGKDVLRRAGSWSGGNPPFGLRAEPEIRGRLTVTVLRREPGEADVIADVVARVLAGASVAGEAKRLNREGSPARAGGEWSTSTLSRVLRSPALAGYLPERRPRPGAAHFDVVPARDESGEPVIVGDAVVDPADWWRLQDVMAGRRGGRGSLGGRGSEPTLLGGSDLLRCASCGGRMGGDRREGGGGSYRCMAHRRGSAKCSGAAVAMRQTDEFVVSAVWERMRPWAFEVGLAGALPEAAPSPLLAEVARRYAAAHVDPADEAAARVAAATLADAEAALVRLDDDRAAGVFEGTTGTDRYRRQVAILEDRAEAARATLAATSHGTGGAGALEALFDEMEGFQRSPADPDSPWHSWTLEQKRGFLSLFLDRVEVSKGQHGGGNAPWRGAERLRLVWADEVLTT